MYKYINRAFDIFNKNSEVQITTPNYRSFGNGSEEIFYSLLKAQKENKKVLFLYPKLGFGKYALTVTNKERFLLQSEFILSNETFFGHIGGWLLSAYVLLLWGLDGLRQSRILRYLLSLFFNKLKSLENDHRYIVPMIGTSTLWKPMEVTNFSWEEVEKMNWKQQFEDYIPPQLSKDKDSFCRNLRIEMGISNEDWFVCLHVSQNNPPIPRNASISNYIEAIKEITARGGWVVRLGDSSMPRLPSMERVIDYPFTEYKSEVMDLYLIKNCTFFIGCSSGPPMVAALFKKPKVIVNMTVWSIDFPIRKGDLVLFKHIYSKSLNRFLSIQEVLKEPYAVEVMSRVSENYMLEENKSHEIRDVVKEFLQDHDSELNDFQKKFNEGRSLQIHAWIDSGEPKNWPGVAKENIITHQFRIGSLADSVSGSMGKKYLEENWIEDSLNRL